MNDPQAKQAKQAKQVVTMAIPPEALMQVKELAEINKRSVSQTLCLLVLQALEVNQQPQPETLTLTQSQPATREQAWQTLGS